MTGRPAHEGSSAHGTFCSDPVGTTTSGRPASSGIRRSSASSARAALSRSRVRGRVVQRGGQVGPQQPGDGEGDAVEQVVGAPHRADPVQPHPARGQRDRDERAVGVDELEQPGVAQPCGQFVDGGGRRQGIRRPAAVQRPLPDAPLQGRLPGQQRPGLLAPAGAVQLVDLQDGPAQGGEHLRGLRVVRRAARALHEQPGRPAALGPLQHVARTPRTQRDAQPELGQCGAVPGRVRPDVDGAQHGAVLVEQPQAGRGSRRGHLAGCPRRRAASASAYQPRARSIAGPARRVPGRLAQMRGGLGVLLRGGAAGSRSRMRASRADDGQRAAVSVRVTSRAARTSAARAHPSGQRRAQHQEPGERGPLRPVLAAELPRRPPGVRQRGRGVAVEQGGLGEDQPGLRQLHVAAAAGVLRDGLLRRLARLADQPHREQEIGPVDQQLAQAAVLLADALLRGVGVGERGRGLPAQAEHERQVGLGESHLQRQRLLPREPLRQAQVRLRRRRTRAGRHGRGRGSRSPGGPRTRRRRRAAPAAPRGSGPAPRRGGPGRAAPRRAGPARGPGPAGRRACPPPGRARRGRAARARARRAGTPR